VVLVPHRPRVGQVPLPDAAQAGQLEEEDGDEREDPGRAVPIPRGLGEAETLEHEGGALHRHHRHQPLADRPAEVHALRVAGCVQPGSPRGGPPEEEGTQLPEHPQRGAGRGTGAADGEGVEDRVQGGQAPLDLPGREPGVGGAAAQLLRLGALGVGGRVGEALGRRRAVPAVEEVLRVPPGQLAAPLRLEGPPGQRALQQPPRPLERELPARLLGRHHRELRRPPQIAGPVVVLRQLLGGRADLLEGEREGAVHPRRPRGLRLGDDGLAHPIVPGDEQVVGAAPDLAHEGGPTELVDAALGRVALRGEQERLLLDRPACERHEVEEEPRLVVQAGEPRADDLLDGRRVDRALALPRLGEQRLEPVGHAARVLEELVDQACVRPGAQPLPHPLHRLLRGERPEGEPLGLQGAGPGGGRLPA
jgi:hypothetical protein